MGKHLYHNLAPLMLLIVSPWAGEREYYCSLDYLEKASITIILTKQLVSATIYYGKYTMYQENLGTISYMRRQCVPDPLSQFSRGVGPGNEARHNLACVQGFEAIVNLCIVCSTRFTLKGTGTNNGETPPPPQKKRKKKRGMDSEQLELLCEYSSPSQTTSFSLYSSPLPPRLQHNRNFCMYPSLREALPYILTPSFHEGLLTYLDIL